MIPDVTVRGSSDTPMTPVEATSTSSASQPRARAVSAVISSATLCPASPVQALAQPLLTTMARARPPVEARCAFETSTGAAAARLIVNAPAALAESSATSSIRSSAPARALMPQWTPAVRKPAGAVTPPGTTEIEEDNVEGSISRSRRTTSDDQAP